MLIRQSGVKVLLIFFACMCCAPALAFHPDLASALKKSIGPGQPAGGRDGVVVFGVLPAEAFDFDEWNSVSIVHKNGAIRRDVSPAHCFPSLCLYVSRIDAGAYQFDQIRKIDPQGKTVAAPLGDKFGEFTVETGKITNLGIFGLYQVTNEAGRYDANFDFGLHAEYMGVQDEQYLHRTITEILPDIKPESGIIRWNEGSNFAKRLAMKERSRTIFQEFDWIFSARDGGFYFPVVLGSVVKFNMSGNYEQIRTDTSSGFRSFYAEDSLYLIGAEAGRLYLYRPDRKNLEVLRDFGIDSVVADIFKSGKYFYALVLGQKKKLEVYRFSDINLKDFENISGDRPYALELKNSLTFSERLDLVNRLGFLPDLDRGKSLSSWRIVEIENYQSRVTPRGFYLRLERDKLLHYDFSTEKFSQIPAPSGYSIDRFSVYPDGGIVITTKQYEDTIPVQAAKATAESPQISLEELKKATRSKKSIKLDLTGVFLLKDGQKWEQLAAVSGRVVSNIYFADAGTAYMVFERQVYDPDKKISNALRKQLYKTSDGGREWKQSGSTDSLKYISDDIEIRPDGKNLAFISKSGTSLYVTGDEGKTWQAHSLFDSISGTEKSRKSK